MFIKKYFLPATYLATLIIALFFLSLDTASADSLKQRCQYFDDAWFMDMSYGFGYCNPPNFRDVDVTRAVASFRAHLEIGRVGELEESETTADIDAKFNKDVNGGAAIPLGTRRNENRVSQSFDTVALGDYATLSTYNMWADVLDLENNGKVLWQRQEINITYRIRRGLCYATFRTSGEGPKDSTTFYGMVFAEAKKEAENISSKMKSLTTLCKDENPSSPQPVSPLPAPTPPAPPQPVSAPPVGLPKPTKQEVEDFAKGFAPEIPAIDDDAAPAPQSDDVKSNNNSDAAPSGDDEKEKGMTQKIRADLEGARDLGTIAKDLDDFSKTGKLGGYDGFGLTTDIGNGLIDYNDQRAKGVSVEDAAAKATLDNFGASALTAVPVLKGIDLVAGSPDKVLNALGVSEDNWSRKVTGFVGKFAPSNVVKQTTDLMVEDDWSDIGNALVYGWDKVKAAEGWADTVTEAEKLAAATIGAGAVSVARVFSELTGATIFVGEKTVNFVGSLFTYSIF